MLTLVGAILNFAEQKVNGGNVLEYEVESKRLLQQQGEADRQTGRQAD